MVSGLGLDSEWRATLSVQGSLFAPAITGAAELVRGGYEFAGRRFELQRGVIRFRGESPPDPILDIVAAGDTQGLSAIIRVSGTGLKPDIGPVSRPSARAALTNSRLRLRRNSARTTSTSAIQRNSSISPSTHQKLGVTMEDRIMSRNSTGMPSHISINRCSNKSSSPPK